jgi:hypothetical protein
MKRAAVLAGLTALLCSAACIPVDDFGPYWNRASIDRRLVGEWKQVPMAPGQTPGDGFGIGEVMRIAIKGDAYELTPLDDAGKQRDDPLYPVKTLTVGPHSFLVYGPTDGLMERYRLQGRTLTICWQFGAAMVDFITARYPKAVNIGRNEDDGRFVVIKRFDDEVFRAVASIPDTAWVCNRQYERVR